MSVRRNIVVDKGTYFEYSIEMNDDESSPFDMTQYDVKAEFKKHFESSNSVQFTITKEVGSLTLSLSANATINCDPGRYEYDVFIYPTGSPNLASKILEGLLTIRSSITSIF